MEPDPPTGANRSSLFASWLGFVLAAGAAVVALWFLQKIVVAILLLFFAVVVGIALSAPVGWFVRRGVPRRLAEPLTLVLFFGAIGLLGWLVIPQLARQIVLLVNQLPDFIARIDRQFASLLERYPDLQIISARTDRGRPESRPMRARCSAGIGGVSLSLLGGLALAIIFFSTVAYIVLDPRPILRAYLGSLPRAYQRPGMRAYRRASPGGGRLDQGEPRDRRDPGGRGVHLPQPDGRARRPGLGGARLLRRLHPAHRRLCDGLPAGAAVADHGADDGGLGRALLPRQHRDIGQHRRAQDPRRDDAAPPGAV